MRRSRTQTQTRQGLKRKRTSLGMAGSYKGKFNQRKKHRGVNEYEKRGFSSHEQMRGTQNAAQIIKIPRSFRKKLNDSAFTKIHHYGP